MKDNEQTLKSRLLVIFIVLFLVGIVGIVVYLLTKPVTVNEPLIEPPKRDTALLTKPVTVNEPLIEPPKRDTAKNQSGKISWKAPDEATILFGEAEDEIRHGKELLAHTSVYFGPKGKVDQISNGMDCQNCNNDAGTEPE